jgi:hypothetical protein
MKLGEIRIKDYLEKTHGEVTGTLFSDGKDRYYTATYEWQATPDGQLHISRQGSANAVTLPQVIALDESLVAFFGLYSGDGAKGSENPRAPGLLRPAISFSQREPNLIRFAVRHFKPIFPDARFTYTLGEDSAFFMAGAGLEMLEAYYGGPLPATLPLAQVQPHLNQADRAYLAETRRHQQNPEADLAFYYQHKTAMETILAAQKQGYITASGIALSPQDRVTASLRRPYKKGAREPGGSSRSDETHVGGVAGMGELFLKMLHELEASILEDRRVSAQGLVVWQETPSHIGQVLDVQTFFEHHPYGALNHERPTLAAKSPDRLQGQWPRSKPVTLHASLRLDPLWCYTAGLYLAEGTTTKQKFFTMYRERVAGLALGFTSSENTSLALMLRALQQLFSPEECVDGWKVKVGSQYFPELVVVGLKNAVPMLRGGASGDGKLRTIEISLAIKAWALNVAPALQAYQDKFSHVEPTGAGVPRIDFWASSALCKWYFPLVMIAAFGDSISDPASEFTYA